MCGGSFRVSVGDRFRDRSVGDEFRVSMNMRYRFRVRVSVGINLGLRCC